jgi:hypothetical protein
MGTQMPVDELGDLSIGLHKFGNSMELAQAESQKVQ